MQIAEFVAARLAERAAEADLIHAVACAALSPCPDGCCPMGTCDCGEPQRILTDIAAKQALLEWCAEATGHLDWTGIDTFGWLRDDPYPRATHGCQLALRALAAPHADHPDFNPAWRIDG